MSSKEANADIALNATQSPLAPLFQRGELIGGLSQSGTRILDQLLPLKKGGWEGLRCELQFLQRSSKCREVLDAVQSPLQKGY